MGKTPELMFREKTQFLRDIKDKDSIASPFLVRASAMAVGKTGRPYMTLTLVDRTGEVDAKIWDGVDRYVGQLVPDTLVWIEGRCQLYLGRKQIVIEQAQVLREDEADPKAFISESALDPESLYKTLCQYIASMQDPFYRSLAEAVLIDDPEIIDRLKRAPAAKSVHHAYRTGLLEHVVSITGILDALSKHYGAIVDRDLLFLGGFFHDIGKLWELSYERLTDYTTEGRLIGHHVMGVELVERKIGWLESQPGRMPGRFPWEKKLLVKHVILAHHGKLEYGSPKEPASLEAWLVHMIDDLDSKVNAISRFVAQDQTPGEWTALNKQYGRYFYKGPTKVAEQGTD